MKKTILILAMTFAAGLVMSQSYSGYMYSDRGDLIYNGRTLFRTELLHMLSEEEMKTFQSAQKQRNFGKAFITTGWIGTGISTQFLIVGGAVSIFEITTYGNSSGLGTVIMYLGVPVFLLSQVFMSTGYIFKGIGNGRIGWVANSYNERKLSKESNLSFNYSIVPIIVNDGNTQSLGLGAGLTLNF